MRTQTEGSALGEINIRGITAVMKREFQTDKIINVLTFA